MQTHILIIDDDIELTNLITKFLENHKFKVSSFTNTLLALKKINQKRAYKLLK